MFGCILGQPVFRGNFHSAGTSVESVPECFRTTGVNLHLYHRYPISLILYTNSLCGLMHQEFHFGSRYLTAFFASCFRRRISRRYLHRCCPGNDNGGGIVGSIISWLVRGWRMGTIANKASTVVPGCRAHGPLTA